MKKRKYVVTSLPAVMLFLFLAGPAVQPASAYNELGGNSDLVILIPGQTRDAMPDFWALVPDSYHVAIVMTLGAGDLTVSVRNASFLDDSADIIFGRVGLINTTPIAGSTYSAGKISHTISVPALSIGVIISGIIADWGDINYPLQLHMLFTLAPAAATPADNETGTAE